MMFLRMKRRNSERISLLLLLLYIFSIFAPRVSALAPENEIAALAAVDDEYAAAAFARGNVEVSSRLYELLFQKEESASRIRLIPGGDVFGIRIQEERLTVASAKDGSAFKKGDKILSINGVDTESVEDISSALSNSRGGTVKIDIIRGGERMTLTVIPKYDGGSYKLGVTLKNTASGIGTVTFIDPETNLFGGLGHGVCASESAELVKIKSAEATGVVLGNAVRGEIGKPGELSGILSKNHIGTITDNNECGVFGVLDGRTALTTDAIPIARKDEVKLGAAEIISTVKNGKRSVYKIEITEICNTDAATKSFKIKVTDPMLIALSGGIVRGMSGSPIIQNGMLVGAVTHVMVADPTEGYGIFIENMLASVPKALPNAA